MSAPFLAPDRALALLLVHLLDMAPATDLAAILQGSPFTGPTPMADNMLGYRWTRRFS